MIEEGKRATTAETVANSNDNFPFADRIGYIVLYPTRLLQVYARPALLLVVGGRVGDHPLPLHLVPVRLGIFQHVVVEGRRSPRDRC